MSIDLRKKLKILTMLYSSGSQTVACIGILGDFVNTQIAGPDSQDY